MSGNLDYLIEDEIDYSISFTNTYKQFDDKNIREIECLKLQYPKYFLPILENDLFAGRIYSPLVQFTPQSDFASFGYCMNFNKADNWLNQNILNEEYKNKLIELKTFWKSECTESYIESAYSDELKKCLPCKDYFNYRAVAHPLYRLSGAQLDFNKLLILGLDGLRDTIKKKDLSNSFIKSLLDLLDIFTAVIDKYIEDTNNNEIKDSLNRIKYKAPTTFFDAIQLTYLWFLFSGVLNFARMDKYLARFYVQDIKNNIISEERALDLLCEFFRLIETRDKPYDLRAVVGGLDTDADCDSFAILAIKACMKNHSISPQLTLRHYQGMNEELLNLAYEAIARGCTYPLLYNDDVNVEAVMKAFNVDQDIALNYCPFGCGEYVLERLSIGTPSGIINLAKALEITLNHGKDLETGLTLGLDLGSLEDYKTFEELFNCYKKQVEYFVNYLLMQEELEYKMAAKQASFLSLSLLYDDCIEREKDLLSGGVRYLGGTLESYGNVNTADSLSAIKKLVYEDKTISKEELLKALKTNFQDNEYLQRLLINCPKYGNEDITSDNMLLDVHNHICSYTREIGKSSSLHSYLIVVINNDANTVLGKLTSASADGRRSSAPLANANNPQGGADTKGITAMLNSIVKPDITNHAGSVQNLKLTKDMFSPKLKATTKALLNTYFNKGGAQLMVTVVSKGELEDAIIHPERHQNLIVRVGGFSARFVNLNKEVQQELIGRTLHG